MHEPSSGARGLLSILPAGRGHRRLALATVVVSGVIFLALVPFAKTPLSPMLAFIPIYQSALIVNDLITAVLLFGQFTFLRSRGLLLLAAGYLFTGLMATAHLLTFPGLFFPTGLLGAGPQTTAWLYMFWHAGFPVLVIAYASSVPRGHNPQRPGHQASVVLAVTLAAVAVAAGLLTAVATLGHAALPAIMLGHHYTGTMIVIVSSVWSLSLLALIVLWRRRPHSVLDLWLMVVMCAWVFDIALAAVLNAGRFDLGFYAGRVYGLLAASFVLGVLLVENSQLYSELDQHNRSLETTVRERTARLLQTEKVATMGSLLAGVAHELNNPLAILIGQAGLLQETATEPVVRKRAEKIVAASERCSRIVKNFLALARQQPPERAVVHLNRVVAEAVELLAYELKTANVQVNVQAADGLPPLWADPHQLHQVVVNLVANAHQAMRHSDPPRVISITTRAASGHEAVHLEIADTGPGIPASIQAKIFEPFFTTKPVGQGTGLGLALCQDIIGEHGGAITVDSEPGRGATFVISLPVAHPPTSLVQSRANDASTPIEPKRVLVVDDEADLAEVLGEALRLDGHRVDIASDGRDALARLEREAFDLVVSDTKMPVLDGLELFREINARFEALRHRVIFVSGDVLDAEKRQAVESTGAPFLSKPFDLAEARSVVRRTLGANAAR